MAPADLGLIGHDKETDLFACSLEDEGYQVVWVENDLARAGDGHALENNPSFCRDLETLVCQLPPPRPIFIRAGTSQGLDQIIAFLMPLLQVEDLIIDLGDSYFLDTERRARQVQSGGFRFLGVYFSRRLDGGASKPGFVIGGDPRAFTSSRPIFDSLAQSTDEGSACAEFVGPRGAGHFTGMVYKGLLHCEEALFIETCRLLLSTDAGQIPMLLALMRKEDPGYMILNKLGTVGNPVQEPVRTGPDLRAIVNRADRVGSDPRLLDHARDLETPLQVLSALQAQAQAQGRETAARPEGKVITAADLWTVLQASRAAAWIQVMNFFDKASVEFDYSLNIPSVLNIWDQSTWLRSALLKEIYRLYETKQARTVLRKALAGIVSLPEARESWHRISQVAPDLNVICPGLAAALSFFNINGA